MEFLIIGAGIAGVSAAKKILKHKNEDDRINLITEEEYPFYYRPRLIECLSGEVKIEDIIIHNKDWFNDNDIKFKSGEKVEELIPEEKIIITTKDSYKYDKLLLANGSHAFRPPINGVEKDNIFVLRNAHDIQNIVKQVRKSKHAVVVGGGLLGLESAYNLHKAGLEVDVIEVSEWILPRQLDEAGGSLLKEMLEEKGLNFYLSTGVEEFLGEDLVTGVKLTGEKVINTDIVLLSTGVRSNIGLFKGIDNLEIGRAVKVNRYMKTSIEDIFAAGDISEIDGRFYGTWNPARQQGEIAGLNMVGQKRVFTPVTPSHRLKVVGIDVVSIGDPNPAEEYDTRIERRKDGYKKVILDSSGKPVAAIIVGKFDDSDSLISQINKNV